MNSDSLVSKVLGAKYFKNGSFLEARRGYDPSYSWRSIWGAKSLILEGFKWRIDNGAKVNVWNDALLPGNSSYRAAADSDLSMKVSDLIDHERGDWDLNRIHQILIKEDAYDLRNILISSRLPEDEVYWWPSKDGNYTVRSGYWLRNLRHGCEWSPGHSDADNHLWKAVWNESFTPKL